MANNNLLDDNALGSKGFTATGKKRLTDTIDSYTAELINKSLDFAKTSQVDGMSIEVTHEHVRAAAAKLQNDFGKKPMSGIAVLGNVVEYVCSAGVGLGAGHISQGWGTIVFGLSLAFGILLVSIRVIRSR